MTAVPPTQDELDAALARGRAALDRLTLELDLTDPYAGAAMRAREAQGLSSRRAELVRRWDPGAASRAPGLRQYPWLYSYERWVQPPFYAGDSRDWRPWRHGEATRGEKPAVELAAHMALALVPVANTEILLAEAAAHPEDEHVAALLDVVAPVLRRDLGHAVLERHSWADSFHLWALGRAPRVFAHLQPVAVAVGLTLAARAAREGVVLGRRFPFHDVAQVSASAQLAGGLVLLGIETGLVASLARFVDEARRPSGGWGDGEDPEDVLTTLVAADLLASLDPRFDPGPTAAYLLSQQREDGGWSAMGPDLPWLTGEVLAWIEAAGRPFWTRFRWPRVSGSNLDAKTGLPSFGYFRDLAEFFADLPGLTAATSEVGFLDLAGFKKFNDRFGQEQGDAVIVELARMLDTIPDTQVVRDGGDEFLILGPPGLAGLEARVRETVATWPARFAAAFGADAPVVAPRVVLKPAAGGALREAREVLGRAIGDLKAVAPTPPPEGSFRTLES
jgi:GGDEF domain-containing protein